jgi:hypothetical protein
MEGLGLIDVGFEPCMHVPNFDINEWVKNNLRINQT